MYLTPNGKKSYQQICITLPEKQIQKDLLQENTMILMNWENIIVPFVAIIYSEVRLNLLPLAVGQAFLKPTKMAFLTKEILHTEWSV